MERKRYFIISKSGEGEINNSNIQIKKTKHCNAQLTLVISRNSLHVLFAVVTGVGAGALPSGGEWVPHASAMCEKINK